jgi:hypothetical protein
VAVPSLLGIAGAAEPKWRHVPEAVRANVRATGPIVLAGHSGGGLLLPVIAEAIGPERAALIFVDSFLPPPTGSLSLAPPSQIGQLRSLAVDGVLPPWSRWFGEEVMRKLVPDRALRTTLEEEMPRLPLSYFEETVPLPIGWDVGRCAFLLFTEDTYGSTAEEASARGWPVATVPAGHLAMATEPVAVTDALLGLERKDARSPR